MKQKYSFTGVLGSVLYSSLQDKNNAATSKWEFLTLGDFIICRNGRDNSIQGRGVGAEKEGEKRLHI